MTPRRFQRRVMAEDQRPGVVGFYEPFGERLVASSLASSGVSANPVSQASMPVTAAATPQPAHARSAASRSPSWAAARRMFPSLAPAPSLAATPRPGLGRRVMAHWPAVRAHARQAARRSSPARRTPATAGSRTARTGTARPPCLPGRSGTRRGPRARTGHTSHSFPGHLPLRGRAPLEHRRAGRTVQEVDVGGSPCLPHHPAEQGTGLPGVQGHAPGGLAAAVSEMMSARMVSSGRWRGGAHAVHQG